MQVRYTDCLDQPLQTKNGTRRQEQAVSKRIVGVVAGSSNLDAKFADGDFVVSPFKVPGIQILGLTDVRFDHVAIDEPGLVDLFRHVSHRRPSVDGLVVFFVNFTKGGSVEQCIRLEKLESSIVFLQRDLEFSFGCLVGDMGLVMTANVVAAIGRMLHGQETRRGGELGHVPGAVAVLASVDCLEGSVDWAQPRRRHAVGVCFVVLNRLVAGAVWLAIDLYGGQIALHGRLCLPLGRLALDELVDALVTHHVQLVAQDVQAVRGLGFLFLVEGLDLVELGVEKAEEFGLAEVELADGFEGHVARGGWRRPGAHGEDAPGRGAGVWLDRGARRRVDALGTEDALVSRGQGCVLLVGRRPRPAHLEGIVCRGDGVGQPDRLLRARQHVVGIQGGAGQRQRRRQRARLGRRLAAMRSRPRAGVEAAVAALPVARTRLAARQGLLLGQARSTAAIGPRARAVAAVGDGEGV